MKMRFVSKDKGVKFWPNQSRFLGRAEVEFKVLAY